MHFLIVPLRHVPESPLQRLPIAFLGGGNMADALIGGLVAAGHDAGAITVIEPDAERASALGARHGVRVQAPGSALPSDGIVVLAVKPQQAAAALAETPPPPGSLLVSIAAGLSCDWLGTHLPAGTPVVRCMPNTPARLGAGVSGLWAPAAVDAAARERAAYVLAAAGTVAWLEHEDQINAVTALSGSGPAYVFALGEAMAEAGIALGLPADTAQSLARQTLIGAGRLLAEDGASPGELRARVTSAGGTTAAALDVLGGDLDDLVLRAMQAAERRARELSAPEDAQR